MLTISGPAAGALALCLTAGPLAAQAIAYGEPPPIRAAAPALAPEYRVRLTSAWPQLPAAGGCANGGSEVIEGTLTRSGEDAFAGTLTRHTRLLFCGAHGSTGAACALELEGQGGVLMEGRVVTDPRRPGGPVLQVSWAPAGDHAARVTGACGDGFKAKVERMYLTARHAAAFTLPYAGAPPATEHLEDYAWVVDVR